MLKKIMIGSLVFILVGAIGVAVYDAYAGNTNFQLPGLSISGYQSQGGPGQGHGQGGQGQGQGQGQRHGQGGQGQGQGNGSGVPQAASKEWVTVTGRVVSSDPQSLTVDTLEQGQLVLRLGPQGFAGQQAVTFNPGANVTIQGFEGENGMFQAAQITNQTTQATLHLRDPNGRPLWAGRGQGHQ
jgi:hypothetical protein